MKKLVSFLLFVGLLLIVGVGTLGFSKSKEDYYESITRLNEVLGHINDRYVEEVDPEELTEAAFDGIRKVLDPHTTVFTPKEYGNLKVSTEGEFGGLGITIAIRDEILTIISPLAGTPAFNMGLMAGDRIVKIEGSDTKGITINDAVDKLRGPVGTDVTIDVYREGVPDLIEYTITRANIKIKSVPYFGMINKEIGYIKIIQFSQSTSRDVKSALLDLKQKGMKKLILDLRYNPGGLLSQAIEVSDLFLKKGRTIVSTKGRYQKSEAQSDNDPVFGRTFPLVVLVNEGSASASEIVSGAIQDWDRGLIVGKTTFGKGSVQSILPLDNEGRAIKMTTAFYYLPMGRCINKPENSVPHANDTTKADTAKKVFYTNGGRKMYGEGGISPDVVTEAQALSWYQQTLERQTSFFKFAIKYRPELDSRGLVVGQDWKTEQKVVSAFKKFLDADSVFNSQHTTAENSVNMLEKIIKIDQSPGEFDTTAVIKDKKLALAIANLHDALKHNRDSEFANNNEYIEKGLKREFISAFQGEGERIAFTIKSDLQVLKAVELLKDVSKYKKAIVKK
ncbi:MAG: S41 family peptidase [Fibrobacterales bacterium]